MHNTELSSPEIGLKTQEIKYSAHKKKYFCQKNKSFLFFCKKKSFPT